MAQIRSQIKRGFLRSLYRAAVKGAVTLKSALEAFQDNGFSAIKSGSLVVQTSGAGHSIQFKAPAALDSFSPDSVFELSEELIELYELAVEQGAADDAAAFASMMDEMDTVTQTRTDFSALRAR